MDVSVEHAEVESIRWVNNATSLRGGHTYYFELVLKAYVGVKYLLNLILDDQVLAGVGHGVTLTCEPVPFEEVAENLAELSWHAALVNQIDEFELHYIWEALRE